MYVESREQLAVEAALASTQARRWTGDAFAIDGHRVQLRIQAAYVDELPLALIPVDGDTR